MVGLANGVLGAHGVTGRHLLGAEDRHELVGELLERVRRNDH
jgi:hypothetical protein